MIRSAQIQVCEWPYYANAGGGRATGLIGRRRNWPSRSRFEFLPASLREPFAFGLRGWLACMLGRRRLSFANSIERHALRDK